MNLICVYSIYIILTLIVNYNEAANTCRVPNGRAGECKMLSKCPPMKRLDMNKHKTPDERKFLTQATNVCTTASSARIKVCCPPESTWSSLKVAPVHFPEPATRTRKPIDPTPQPVLLNRNPNYPYNEAPNHNKYEVVTLKNKDLGTQPKIKDNYQDDDDDDDSEEIEYKCGEDVSSSNRIVGGEATTIDQYPWLALLEYESGSTNCGGSLITSRHVLTAAHCIIHRKPVFVRLSEYNTSSTPTDIVETDGGGFESLNVTIVAVENTLPHPDYNSQTTENDIGLVKLIENVVFTDFVRTICLPEINYMPSFTVKTNFTVAGWGSDNYKFSEVKRDVTLPFVPRESCQGNYNYRLKDTQICAGGVRGKDSCRGDSGGPLMFENSNNAYVVVGVVSYGARFCGTEGHAGVYTYTYKYLEWINKEIQGDGTL